MSRYVFTLIWGRGFDHHTGVVVNSYLVPSGWIFMYYWRKCHVLFCVYFWYGTKFMGEISYILWMKSLYLASHYNPCKLTDLYYYLQIIVQTNLETNEKMSSIYYFFSLFLHGTTHRLKLVIAILVNLHIYIFLHGWITLFRALRQMCHFSRIPMTNYILVSSRFYMGYCS